MAGVLGPENVVRVHRKEERRQTAGEPAAERGPERVEEPDLNGPPHRREQARGEFVLAQHIDRSRGQEIVDGIAAGAIDDSSGAPAPAALA